MMTTGQFVTSSSCRGAAPDSQTDELTDGDDDENARAREREREREGAWRAFDLTLMTRTYRSCWDVIIRISDHYSLTRTIIVSMNSKSHWKKVAKVKERKKVKSCERAIMFCGKKRENCVFALPYFGTATPAFLAHFDELLVFASHKKNTPTVEDKRKKEKK